MRARITKTCIREMYQTLHSKQVDNIYKIASQEIFLKHKILIWWNIERSIYIIQYWCKEKKLNFLHFQNTYNMYSTSNFHFYDRIIFKKISPPCNFIFIFPMNVFLYKLHKECPAIIHNEFPNSSITCWSGLNNLWSCCPWGLLIKRHSF